MAGDEIWKDVEGYEGIYQVSNQGRVKSLPRVTLLNGGRRREEPEVIMTYTLRSGYPTLVLRKKGVRKSAQIHRLVAAAFIPNPLKLSIVNHKDYDRTNNHAENLEWCTQLENVRWSSERMSHPRSKVTSNTGEKYISKRGRKYRVQIHYRGIVTSRLFDSMPDAVAYRDEVIQCKKYTGHT